MMSSTALVAAGSRLAVGSSRNSTSRLARQRAGQREALLLAARQPARRTVGQRGEADASSSSRATLVASAGRAGGRQREGDVGRRRAPQHHGLLEHDGAARRRARSVAPSKVMRPAVGATSPMRELQQCRLARSRWGPAARSARRPQISRSTSSRIARCAGRIADTASNRIGSALRLPAARTALDHVALSCMALRPLPDAPGERVDGHDERDQHDAEPDRQRADCPSRSPARSSSSSRA